MIGILLALATASGQEAPPIVGGEETLEHPSSGALMMTQGGQGMFFCSATLIHPEWVATAAHCVEAAEEHFGRSGVGVDFVLGSNVHRGSGVDYELEVAELLVHPEYDRQRLRHDIGLMRLDGLFYDVTPAPLSDARPGNHWRDEDLTFVGFGVTSDNGDDSGVKRTIDLPFYEWDDYFLYVVDPEGGNLCSGDSGGGGFKSNEEGVLALAGVNSFVFATQEGGQGCEGGGAGATRVDTHLEWFDEYVDWDTLLPPEEEEPDNWVDTGFEATSGNSFSDEGLSAGGCACSATPGPRRGFGWMVLVGLLLPWRRRT
jgi:MYXO-CTERM domain-containing protein